MPLTPSREVFITCAVTGSGDTAGKSPHVPVTPEQIAKSRIACEIDVRVSICMVNRSRYGIRGILNVQCSTRNVQS